MNLENNTSVLPPESAVGMPKDRRREALGNLCVLPDEILCEILNSLAPIDVARLSCVSSVMYILCNEEPLWMSLCLHNVTRPIEYRGSWKKTTLHQLDFPSEYYEASKKPLHFDGFNSLFLYRRLYRCHTSLNGFSFDSGTVERKENIDVEEFQREYDGRKPVLISGLADNWQARKSWTTEQVLVKYGDTKFRLSQRSSRKITMKFKDYLSYMQIQHDEDPLYIFDDKFGDAAPDLLKEYAVPHLFQEDYFDILDSEKRPPFRWLIIGPERSGASWHVDPALTSAWNTLICGRKRWALYPPGRVPLGVMVHVNEEDGDVNVDGPSSLQWWLDFYPLLPDTEKPIEFTQLPGETIFVPSGWWHCVLNLETTIAVTQNFVNSKNFEFACLDMAPGYRHKGVCRAGVLALDEGIVDYVKKNGLCLDDNLSSESTRKEKRLRKCHPAEDSKNENDTNDWSKSNCLDSMEFSYDINFLAMFLDKERDHYNSLWGPGNCIGQREMREWLWKLWLGRPGIRDLIWKGACLALNVGKWFERVVEICSFHGFPSPLHDEKLPVGMGSNPVYLVADYAIKIFAEGGLEASLYGLGSELEFYNLLDKVGSPLKNYIPGVLASGILLLENGSYRVLPWDGKGIPEVIANCNFVSMDHRKIDYPFGIWSKKLFEYRNAGISPHESGNSGGCSLIWPYIVTKRCKGKMFAELRDTLQWEDALNLASFLGEQLHNLHLVPCPSTNVSLLTVGEQIELPHDMKSSEIATDKINMTAEWSLFISTINKKRKDLSDRLSKWGDPIPNKLIEKVAEYIPHDFAEFLDIFENEKEVSKSCTWVHSDVMDDNIYMTQCSSDPLSGGSTNPFPAEDGHTNSYGSNDGQNYSWHPSHILDFSNLSIGDPMLDLIPIHLDIFRGDSHLLKQFLKSYGLELGRKKSPNKLVNDNKLQRLSYRAMCYCIVHDENILGAIFSLWKELRMANSWEGVEETVWGDLNNYAAGFR